MAWLASRTISYTFIEIRVDMLWPKFAMVETSRLCIVYTTEREKLKDVSADAINTIAHLPIWI